MALDPHTLPDSFKRKIAPLDRKTMGAAGMTMDELISREQVHNEKQFQSQVAAYLSLRGIPYYRSRMDKRTTNKVGQPDFICCVAGRFVALECKQEGQEATPEQGQEIKAINDAGGIAWVVFDLAEVKAILDVLMRP